jgi:hypothetical protein
MKRVRVFACAVCTVLLSASPASSAAYYGFTVGVADAPRPPVIRMAREPHALLANDAMVYVVDDDALRFDGDLFRYGQYWFAYTRGYWYRARSHRGPYALLEVHKVPRAIIGVPRKLWKHHPLAIAPAKATSAGTVAHLKPAATAKKATPARPAVRREAAASAPAAHAARAVRVAGPPAPKRSPRYGVAPAGGAVAANAPEAREARRSRRESAR